MPGLVPGWRPVTGAASARALRRAVPAVGLVALMVVALAAETARGAPEKQADAGRAQAHERVLSRTGAGGAAGLRRAGRVREPARGADARTPGRDRPAVPGSRAIVSGGGLIGSFAAPVRRAVAEDTRVIRSRAAVPRPSRGPGTAAAPTPRQRSVARALPGRRAAARRLARVTRSAAREGLSAALVADRLLARPLIRLAAGVPSVLPGITGAAGQEREATPREDPRAASPVAKRVREIVNVVPAPLKVALTALAALSVLLLCGYLLTTLRARRLARQRRALLHEVGLLQAALMPALPEQIGGVRTTVAYRPSEGVAAGGDFYDAFPLPQGRAGFVLGDVAGHGREALSHTAFMRYTLRAYLEAGLEPRVALRVGERVMGRQLGGSFATVIVAVHDPDRGTLTYASAGHPAPILVGEEPHESVPAAGCPAIGWGLPTGLRQTTIPLAAGSRALLYTDGLEEAPTRDGGRLGRERLTEIAAECDSAAEILERLTSVAVELPDDMVACLIEPVGGAATATPTRTEQLELIGDEAEEDLLEAFLEGCGVAPRERERMRGLLAGRLRTHGRVLVNVTLDEERPRVEVAPSDGGSLATVSG